MARRTTLGAMALAGVVVLTALLADPSGEVSDQGPLRFPEEYDVTLRPLPGPTFLLVEGCLEGGAGEVALEAATPQVVGDASAHEVLVNWGPPSPIGADRVSELPDTFRPVSEATTGTVAACGEALGQLELAVTAPAATDADVVVDGLLVQYVVDGERHREVVDVRFVSCANDVGASEACTDPQ